MTPIELARAYAFHYGWAVFPCHSIQRGQCTCGKGAKCPSPGKHPRTMNGVKDATTDLTVIDSWWSAWPEANISLACGRVSGVFVIDIDPRHGGYDSIEQYEQGRNDPLPPTLIALTGGGGRHMFYRYPAGNDPIGNRQNWLPGVDIKSDGGYVVLPESNHVSGGSYSWLNLTTPLTVADAPPDVLRSIRSNADGASGKESLADASEILRGIPEGKRDETIFRWACRLRRQHSGDADGGRAVIETLVATAAAAAQPPFPLDEAMAKVAQAFKQDHSDEVWDWGYIAEDGEPIHHLTDLGNALRFGDEFSHHLRHVPAWGWLAWTTMGWDRVTETEVMEYVRKIPGVIRDEAPRFKTDPQKAQNITKWAMASEAAGKLNAIESLSRSNNSMLTSHLLFDTNDFELACRNGIVDLETGKVRSFERDDYVTKNTNVVFDPTVTSDAWKRFLVQSTQGDAELEEYLQLAAGYTLTGSNAAECFFIVSGPPASGKSTFLDALQGALGNYAATTQSDTFMYKRGVQTPKEELARLAGKRMVSVSEIRQGDSFHESLIKQFTGGDMVSARFLYKDMFEYRPQMKLWIATNHDPDTRDAAMWRRLNKISFDHAVDQSHQDPNLKAFLRDSEAGGRAVLAWAVEGAKKWIASGAGKIPAPVKVEMATAAYRAEQDRFGHFLQESTEHAPGEHVPERDLFSLYVAWSKIGNEYPLRPPQFTSELRARGYDVMHSESLNARVVNGLRIRQVHVGVGGMGWG